jgi:hypothetical protein
MAHLMVPNAVDGIFSLAALQWASAMIWFRLAGPH